MVRPGPHCGVEELDSFDANSVWSRNLASVTGFTDFLRLYYDTMTARPELPKLILKVLALNQGPGRRFIQQLLERGRTRAPARYRT